MAVQYQVQVFDVLDGFLTYLSEYPGEHRVKDVSNYLCIGVDKVKRIIDFFQRYEFITYNETSETVRINEDVEQLYKAR